MPSTKINLNGIHEIDITLPGATTAVLSSPGVIAVTSNQLIATATTPGSVKPDGVTIHIDSNGILSASTVYLPQRTAINDTNYTVLATDYLLAFTALTAPRTLTLPSPSPANLGQIYIVKDESGSATANNLTIVAATGQIDGASSKSVILNYGSARFYSTGTAWFSF